MTVTVPAGMQANWFAVPVGGTALVSNSLTYNHTNGSPGVYTYYVETYDPATGCYSLSRLEVQVEIFSKPQVNNHTLTLWMPAITAPNHLTSMKPMVKLLRWPIP